MAPSAGMLQVVLNYSNLLVYSFQILQKQQSSLQIIKKKLEGYVGFHNLPNQVHLKSIKKGFQFNLMVAGESGLGKSTLVNTLFNSAVYAPKEPQQLSEETPKTVEINTVSAEIEENGVSLKLNITDTPGFGDFLNNEESWKPILDNIESRFEAFLEQENKVNRKKTEDTRLHACLYFIAPSGHSLKPLDLEFMKRVAHRVNLIPVIAKSDTLTEDEIEGFKQRIMDDINQHGIPVYKPQVYDNDDPETIRENEAILSRIPFAVVGSSKTFQIDGKTVRGRQYPWGIVDVDNEDHCDFVKLRQMLIRTHMEELKEYTNEVLYENYRTQKIQTGAFKYQDLPSAAMMAKFEEEKAAHEQKMAKMSNEMNQVFQQKVAEKETKLKASEDELYARHREMKEQLEKQRMELEEKRRKLDGNPATPDKTKRTKGLFK